MTPVSKRFLQIIDYLTMTGKIKNGRDFAHQIGAPSPAMVTEIKKGRTEIGPKYMAIVVTKWNLNGHWLLTGEGSITGNNTTNLEIENLLKKISLLKTENSILKQIRGKNFKLISNIAPPKSKHKGSQALTKR